MTILRTMTICSAALSLVTVAGCCSVSIKKSKDCGPCQTAGPCCESTTPLPGSTGAPLLIPTPVPAPLPSTVPQASPDIPAPPPPTGAQRLSPIQTMRHHTTEFFRSASDNVRAVFTR
jgi:hypothetical protein